MSNHTPAPWKSRADDTGVSVTGKDGFNVARIAWFDEAGDPTGENDPAIANSHLIEAAPNLLSAAKALMSSTFADNYRLISPFKELAAAIAKAEGVRA